MWLYRRGTKKTGIMEWTSTATICNLSWRICVLCVSAAASLTYWIRWILSPAFDRQPLCDFKGTLSDFQRQTAHTLCTIDSSHQSTLYLNPLHPEYKLTGNAHFGAFQTMKNFNIANYFQIFFFFFSTYVNMHLSSSNAILC